MRKRLDFGRENKKGNCIFFEKTKFDTIKKWYITKLESLLLNLNNYINWRKNIQPVLAEQYINLVSVLKVKRFAFHYFLQSAAFEKSKTHF